MPGLSFGVLAAPSLRRGAPVEQGHTLFCTTYMVDVLVQGAMFEGCETDSDSAWSEVLQPLDFSWSSEQLLICNLRSFFPANFASFSLRLTGELTKDLTRSQSFDTLGAPRFETFYVSFS